MIRAGGARALANHVALIGGTGIGELAIDIDPGALSDERENRFSPAVEGDDRVTGVLSLELPLRPALELGG